MGTLNNLPKIIQVKTESLHTKLINNKDLLYSYYLVIIHNGKEFEKEYIHM